MSEASANIQVSVLSTIRGIARTDIGRRREENQDSYGIIENEHFKMFIVADGMGGVKGGAVASSTAIAVIQKELAKATTLDEHIISSTIHEANARILAEAGTKPALTGMGTTCVGIAFVGTQLLLVNVGDSRAYRIRNNDVKQLTEDHTLVMELLRSGTISPDQAENHPVSHMLTRSLGPTPDLEVDAWVCPYAPAKKDIYLLCSDGLYNLVTQQDMAAIIGSLPLEEAAEKLIALANERGGTDNITVILVALSEEYPLDIPQVEDRQAPSEEPLRSADYVNGDDSGANSGFLNGVASHVQQNGSMLHSAPPLNVERPEVSETKHSDVSDTIELDLQAEKRAQAVLNSVALRTLMKVQRFLDFVRDVRQALPLYLSGRYGLLIVGILIGSAGMLFVGRFGGDSEPPPTAIKPRNLSAASLSPEINNGTAPLPIKDSAAELSALAQDMKTMSIASTASQQRERLVERKEALTQRIADLNRKISSFEQPLSGNVAQILRDSQARNEELVAQAEKLRAEIDMATRKLTVWHQRKQKLQDTDPVNLANEVSVSSEQVRAKKDEFERITWSYLREAEVLVYSPTDQQQNQKVSELRRQRKEKKSELVDEIRAAIERAASEADQRITELTVERDKVTLQLNDARRDAAYSRAIMGDDQQAKMNLLQELTRERDLGQEELESLEHITASSAVNSDD